MTPDSRKRSNEQWPPPICAADRRSRHGLPENLSSVSEPRVDTRGVGPNTPPRGLLSDSAGSRWRSAILGWPSAGRSQRSGARMLVHSTMSAVKQTGYSDFAQKTMRMVKDSNPLLTAVQVTRSNTRNHQRQVPDARHFEEDPGPILRVARFWWVWGLVEHAAGPGGKGGFGGQVTDGEPQLNEAGSAHDDSSLMRSAGRFPVR